MLVSKRTKKTGPIRILKSIPNNIPFKIIVANTSVIYTKIVSALRISQIYNKKRGALLLGASFSTFDSRFIQQSFFE